MSSYDEIPDELIEFVEVKLNGYFVKKGSVGGGITFGKFNSLKEACAAACILYRNNWKLMDVVNNPLVDYGDESWVFKVEDNKLVLDSKFDDFESAVEYVEINSRCNDYHNDIFTKKKRKPKYANMIKDEFKNYGNIPNIYEKGKLFTVKYRSNGKEYGIFKYIDEAIVAKNLLIENNWKFSNNVEMKFYDSLYWIFKIENNVLFFVDKFKSYEDALDCLDLVKSYKYEFDGFTLEKYLDEYRVADVEYEIYGSEDINQLAVHSKLTSDNKSNSRVKDRVPKRRRGESTKTKSNSKKRKRKEKKVNKRSNVFHSTKIKRVVTRDNVIIKELDKFNKENFHINVENFKQGLNIIQFQDNILKDYYSISFLNSHEIKFSRNIRELKELKYILKVLKIYGWDLNKINDSSAIHYIDDSYYIIKSFNGKLIISGSFDSFGEAEENIDFLYGYYSYDEIIPSNIQKHGDYYKYIADHNGKTFEIAYQKSLETLKAIIDILKYYNWNPLEFEDYDIYCYHGLYWEIDYFNYYIKLKGRFYSKEDAIKHKISN